MPPGSASGQTAQEKEAARQAEERAQRAEELSRKQRLAEIEFQRQLEEKARVERQAEQRRIDAMQKMLDVEIVISRYQGDKKTSSLPYALSIRAVHKVAASEEPVTRLRMGGQIPVPVMSVSPDTKAPVPIAGPVQYRDVGTSIDGGARPLDNDTFELYISVEETAIASLTQGASAAPVGGPPVLRTFQASNTLVLRDGQTRQFTAASDRITGEVVRVDVTLRVAK
jgi:hypothetical protein